MGVDGTVNFPPVRSPCARRVPVPGSHNRFQMRYGVFPPGVFLSNSAGMTSRFSRARIPFYDYNDRISRTLALHSLHIAVCYHPIDLPSHLLFVVYIIDHLLLLTVPFPRIYCLRSFIRPQCCPPVQSLIHPSSPRFFV